MKLSVSLQRLRDRITPKAKWCQGELARDILRRPCKPASRWAVKWDAVGVIAKLGRASARHTVRMKMEQLAQEMHQLSLSAVNDQLGHRAVLALYDLAIQRQQEREK